VTDAATEAALRMRRAEPRDLAALIGLESAAFADDRISARSWKHLVASPSAVVAIAEAEGTVHGAIVLLYRATSSVARIYSIAVAPGSRGQGIAGRLMAFAIERSHNDGAAVLHLETRLDNVKAQSLFERFGFSRFGRHARYYADGADALRYRKNLFKGN
jgi:ribosomal protein S18 acetylase RimI-like enzyme